MPQWVWLGDKPADGQTVYFRKEFVVRGGLTAARLLAACDDRMTVYLDGKEVVAGDRWDRPVFKDLTADMSTEKNPRAGGGRHVLAVKGYNRSGTAGLLVRLEIEPGSGEPAVVVSDASWRVSDKEVPGWQGLAFDDKAWAAATAVAKLGDKPWAKLNEVSLAALTRLREPAATPAESLKIAKGFKAELLYSVPKDREGSWVNLCVDPKGRLIVSDQYGGMFRVTPPPVGGAPGETRVEKIPAAIGEAQGLLWAFDSLYVVVNKGAKYDSGLYRVRSSNHDDVLDEVTLLRKLNGGGEHGPHAVVLAPDGQSLYIICGNNTKLTDLAGSRVPRIWGEDHILPRMPDGRGFMRGVLAPGGCVYKVDPDGREWELVCNGFRNPFDMAFNRHGDLFTFDADMEWDFNTPWYRPTRVCLVASGGEFGWRNGAGKWPPYYPDSLPAVLDIGPGSPTGVTFGYGARFPARYQEALFICDWSYGKLYAVHLTPDGSAYRGEAEEFLAGTPLPLTDVAVNPADGAMYFAIGGRKTKSGLYRVTYVGGDSTAPATPHPGPPPQGGRGPIPSPLVGEGQGGGAELRAVRHRLEALHGRRDPAAVGAAWPYLGHPDRYIRFAARVAVEHQAPAAWRDRALAEADPAAAVTALLALVRVSAADPFHRPPPNPPPTGGGGLGGGSPDPELRSRVLAALARLDWDRLSEAQRLDLLRVYEVLFNRFGRPGEPERQQVIDRLDPHYPAGGRFVNAELCHLLVFLEAPGVVAKTLRLLADAPTQEEQIEYARALRVLKAGWLSEQRMEYFVWLRKAAGYKGGASFGGFLRNIRDDAVATLTKEEMEILKPLLETKPPAAATTAVVISRPFVKSWTVAELAPRVEKGLTGRDFDRGRRLFGEASCFACHRFDSDGGAQGPDLTVAAGRFSARDLLESIIEPSKEISDQYAAVTITTADGRVVTGRIVNLAGDSVSVLTNLTDPNGITRVDRKLVESVEVSKVSMMPAGLLDTFTEDEVLDLVAYLLSRGDRASPLFRRE
jgi:putative heme-binding domain-containing protein